MTQQARRQFSLRTLLFVVTLISLASAWFYPLRTKPFFAMLCLIPYLVCLAMSVIAYRALRTRDRRRIIVLAATTVAGLLGLWYGVITQTTILARLEKSPTWSALSVDLLLAGFAFGGIAAFIGRGLSTLLLLHDKWRRGLRFRVMASFTGALVAVALWILRAMEDPDLGGLRLGIVSVGLGTSFGYLVGLKLDRGGVDVCDSTAVKAAINR